MSKRTNSNSPKMAVPPYGKTREIKSVYGQTPDGTPVELRTEARVFPTVVHNDTSMVMTLGDAIATGLIRNKNVARNPDGTVTIPGSVRRRHDDGREYYINRPLPEVTPYGDFRQFMVDVPLIGTFFRKSGGRIEYFK